MGPDHLTSSSEPKESPVRQRHSHTFEDIFSLGTHFKRWLSKGSWAIADQVLYGMTSFAINVMFARWLTAPEYGAFAVAFAMYFLLLAVYNALVVEPMLVFGPARYRERQTLYLGLLTYLQSGLAMLMALSLLAAGAVLAQEPQSLMRSALHGIALATPCLLFFWFMRRACYVRQQPRLAAFGSAAYSTLTLTSVWLLYQFDLLSIENVFFALAASSMGTAVGFSRWVDVTWDVRGHRMLLRDILYQHWIYGRWATATRVPMRLPANIIYMALPLWGGLGASGTLKALLNLVQPINQVISALTVLLIPTLARKRQRSSLNLLTLRLFAVFSGSALLGWIVLGATGPWVVEWLYGGAFSSHVHLLWILGLMPVFGAGGNVLGAALRADERPDQIFWVYAIATAVGLPVTLGLIAWHGLAGAATGMVVMSLFTMAGLLFYFRQISSKSTPVSTALIGVSTSPSASKEAEAIQTNTE